MIGCGYSSYDVGRSILGFAVEEWEDGVKFDEVRRIAGDRGGVCPPALCSELRDGRLCIAGVVDRSLMLKELELGVLRRGLFCTCWGPCVEDKPSAACLNGEAAGEDGGRAVAAAAPSESRLESVGNRPLSDESTVP